MGRGVGAASDSQESVHGERSCREYLPVRALERTPNGSRLRWDLEGPERLAVAILPEDLTELLGNVLENASNWAASRVQVRVAIGDSALVRIVDDGPGVPADGLERLGQRGLRLDERTQGSGLGLAIAQDICDAYGGDLTFARADLGGLAVTLRLPVGAGAGPGHPRSPPARPGAAAP